MLDILISILKKWLGSNSAKSENSSKEVNLPVQKNNMALTLSAYFSDPKTNKDRREEYIEDYNNDILKNAEFLLSKINALLSDLGIIAIPISSGWRPSSVNVAIGGAKNSAHCTGEACDLADKSGELKRQLMDNLHLLEKHDLYMEDPQYSPTWVHLQSRKIKSGNRIFKP